VKWTAFDCPSRSVLRFGKAASWLCQTSTDLPKPGRVTIERKPPIHNGITGLVKLNGVWLSAISFAKPQRTYQSHGE
jgi:hypothetical protein